MLLGIWSSRASSDGSLIGNQPAIKAVLRPNEQAVSGVGFGNASRQPATAPLPRGGRSYGDERGVTHPEQLGLRLQANYRDYRSERVASKFAELKRNLWSPVSLK